MPQRIHALVSALVHRPLVPFCIAGATLATSAAGQNSVTETRVINEVVNVAAPSGPDIQEFVGLLGPTTTTHGQPLRVEMSFDLTFDVDVTITNTSTATRDYEIVGLLDRQYLSSSAFCAQYSGVSIGIDLGSVAPGATETFTQTQAYTLGWSGTDFDGFCTFDWRWDDASIVEFFDFPVQFHINGGPGFEGITTNRMDLHIDGQFEAEWVPNEFAHASVCPGNFGQPTTLTPGGADGNVWLTQTGVPSTWGILVRSDTAQPSVPASGLCVGQGGASIVRLNDSLSVGGEAYRFEGAAAFAGVRQYFQSAFRSPSGGFRTGECIGVVLP